MNNNRYRKKPVIIEAFQMTRERRMDNKDWPTWLNKAWNMDPQETGAVFRASLQTPPPDHLMVRTLEGALLISFDDWIIRGVNGELYPCKPDIFARTYERVDDWAQDSGA